MSYSADSTEDHEYIGDGVYVAHDGHGMWLLTASHDDPTDKIYIEPEVWERLLRWRAQIAEAGKRDGP